MKVYIAANRDWNEALPISPGKHGYMFFGLPGSSHDDLKLVKPATFPVFVKHLDRKGESIWVYYGEYSIWQDDSWSPDEWATLRPEVPISSIVTLILLTQIIGPKAIR